MVFHDYAFFLLSNSQRGSAGSVSLFENFPYWLVMPMNLGVGMLVVCS